MPATSTARVPRQNHSARIVESEQPSEREEMTGEEAMAVYREWRLRVIGGRTTEAADLFELLARLREEPGS